MLTLICPESVVIQNQNIVYNFAEAHFAPQFTFELDIKLSILTHKFDPPFQLPLKCELKLQNKGLMMILSRVKRELTKGG